MSRVNLEDNKAYGLRICAGLHFDSMDWVPADNAVLDEDSPTLIFANPAGAVDILLPVSNAQNKGLAFLICNQSANVITCKTSADLAFTTAIAIAAGTSVWVVCTGLSSPVLGWRAV